jgi:hypothetical protein
VLHGPPDVTITAPARITRDYLAGELPPVLVVGPPEVRASLFLFVDRDHDGQLGPAELIVRFLSIADDVGCAIEGARLTSTQLEMAQQQEAKDTMWGVEVDVPGTNLRHVAIHGVE